MIKEISSEDFTAEKWARLVQVVDNKCKAPRRINPEHFFPNTQALMAQGMAKVWGSEDQRALLVSLFFPNFFSGDPVGMAQLWVSLDAASSIELFEKFQAEVQKRGCVASYASAFRSYRTAGMTRLFRRMGFEPHEVGFVKMI